MWAAGLAVLACLVGAPAAVATQPAGCDARAGRTLASDRLVRVFTREKRYHGRLQSLSTYACYRPSGRLAYFGDGESGKDGASIRLLTLAGRYVGYVFDTGFLRTVTTRDVASGKVVRHDSAAYDQRNDDGQAPPVESLVLTVRGGVGWISAPGALGDGYELHLAPAAGPVAIASAGSDIAPQSLALAPAGVVYWTQGGGVRSAPLP
jgi:hypothetical protein